MVKNSRVICFDIDDCILPHYNMLPKRHRLDIFRLNLERLVHLSVITDSKLFVTSSWGMIWKLIDGELHFKDEFDWVSDFEVEITDILNNYLNGRIIGLSKGERNEDIDELLKAGNRVVALDDMDLSNIKNDDFLYILVETMISDRHIRIIKKFMEDNKNG